MIFRMILTLCTLMVFAQGQVYAQANTFFQLLDANSANAGAPPFFPTTQPLNSTIQDTELSGLKEKLKPEPLSTIEEMFNQKLKHSSTTLSPIQRSVRFIIIMLY